MWNSLPVTLTRSSSIFCLKKKSEKKNLTDSRSVAEVLCFLHTVQSSKPL